MYKRILFAISQSRRRGVSAVRPSTKFPSLFYDMEADGFSLDDKRDPITANDIPDILEKWAKRDPKKDTERNGKAFFVPKSEIVENKYDLSINRYKHVDHEEIEFESPTTILNHLDSLESQIMADLKELRGLLA